MSKVDAQRAMREARYAALEAAAKAAGKAGAPARATVAKAPVAPVRAPAVRAAVAAPEGAQGQVEPVSDGLCGHRNMGGRSCTREADHQRAGTKNHRYA